MAWTEQNPNGSWRGVYRNAEDRKRSKGGFRYRGEALSWAVEAEREALGLTEPDPEDLGALDFAKYAEGWLARRTSKAPATLKRYTSALAGILDSAPFVSTPVAQVTAAQVEAWFGAMDAEGSGVGVPTRNYRLTILRMIFSQARKDKIRGADGIVIDDPSADIGKTIQRDGTRKRLFLTEAEVAALLAAAKELDDTGNDYLVALLGLNAGLRWGEIAALSIDDIHLEADQPYLKVWRSVIRSVNRIQETTKNGEPRTVPVDPELADALRTRAVDMFLLNGPGSLLIPRSFTDPQPIAYSTGEGRFAAMVKRSGISRQPIGWHDFRHTYGSRLAHENVPVPIIAKVMGHRQEDVTRLYLHAADTAVQHTEVTRALAARRAAA